MLAWFPEHFVFYPWKHWQFCIKIFWYCLCGENLKIILYSSMSIFYEVFFIPTVLLKKLLHLWDCIFVWTGTQFPLFQKSLFIPMMLNSQTASYYNRDCWDEFPTLSSYIRTACLFLKFLKFFLIFVRWILLLLERAQFLCWTLSCLKMQFLLHIF